MFLPNRLLEKRYGVQVELWKAQFELKKLQDLCADMQKRIEVLESQIERSRSGRFQKGIREEREGLILTIIENHRIMQKLHGTISHKRKEWSEIEVEVRRIYAAVGSTARSPLDVDIVYDQSMQKQSEKFHFDIFVSHASEDKDSVARPLSTFLTELGLRVWFDETVLKVGDSLRRSIDFGLSRSRFGLVIISPAFLSKSWTQYELDSLTVRQLDSGKVILPIWHKVSKDEVSAYSLKLADTVALHTSTATLEDIALSLALVVARPERFPIQ